jgi:hypothetical protein
MISVKDVDKSVICCWWKWKMMQPPCKKLNPESSYDPAILFLGILFKRIENKPTQKLEHECSQQSYS